MKGPLYKWGLFLYLDSMHHSEIINHYIKKYNLKSYLEIGTRNRADNFNKIQATEKICIDPDIIAYADFVLTSDEFFRICNKKFDIVFVDGLHEGHQVYKDIQNSLKHLNQGGVIICHDINPAQFENGYDYEEYDGTGIWNGDCWKGFVKYRYTSDYECYVLPEDEADVGVIDTNIKSTINEKKYFNLGELTFNDLNNNRNEWLNIKTLEEVGIL